MKLCLKLQNKRRLKITFCHSAANISEEIAVPNSVNNLHIIITNRLRATVRNFALLPDFVNFAHKWSSALCKYQLIVPASRTVFAEGGEEHLALHVIVKTATRQTSH
jgi:hypothetical protein